MEEGLELFKIHEVTRIDPIPSLSDWQTRGYVAGRSGYEATMKYCEELGIDRNDLRIYADEVTVPGFHITLTPVTKNGEEFIAEELKIFAIDKMTSSSLQNIEHLVEEEAHEAMMKYCEKLDRYYEKIGIGKSDLYKIGIGAHQVIVPGFKITVTPLEK